MQAEAGESAAAADAGPDPRQPMDARLAAGGAAATGAATGAAAAAPPEQARTTRHRQWRFASHLSGNIAVLMSTSVITAYRS